MQQAVNFKSYISAFEKELERVVLNDISAAVYCKKYLSHLLQHKNYYLAIYADVFDKLLAHSSKRKEDITLVDYGAGNGLLGIFAKFCGFKKILIIDIDNKFIQAAGQLALQLDIKPDAYITGDVEALRSYCSNEKPDAITGTDVIEHIYDLDDFFKALWDINPAIVSVFTTASNPVNFFKVRNLKKIQRKDELEGGEPGDHALFGETSLEPFIKIREKIIRKHAPQLTDTTVMALAEATRGLHEADIIKALAQYHISKRIPVPVDDFNTCNPLNSSWTERILSLEAYISVYRSAGFTCKIYAGFYNQYGSGMGSFVKKLLNAGIHILGKRISPYIVIVGQQG